MYQFAFFIVIIMLFLALWAYRKWNAESKAAKAYNLELDWYEAQKHNIYIVATDVNDKTVKSRVLYAQQKLEESQNLLYKSGQLQVVGFPIRPAGDNYFELYHHYLVRVGGEVRDIEINKSGEQFKADPEGWEETIYQDEKPNNYDGEWDNKKFKKSAFSIFGF